jgi:hypothetical protein
LTRRQILLGGGGAAAFAIAGGGIAEVLEGFSRLPRIRSFGVKPTGRAHGFRSRPDLRAPIVTSAERLAQSDPGFLLLGPGPVSLKGARQYGPLIVDRHGELVWFRPLAPGLEVTNFARSRYRGEPVLVWWEGKVLPSGYGQGEAVILDRDYREVTRVRAAGGRSMDLHALSLTSSGTALFTCYPDTVTTDLSRIGGHSDSQAFESIIQEVDIASGRLLFEWRSLEHIDIDSSHRTLHEPYDYLHANSVQELPDGNLLVSARNAWAVYKLERRTGDVIWTLGGKRSEFQIGSDADFAWQHDARQVSDGVLTMFDNGSDGPIESRPESRGLVLDVDELRRTVAVRHGYPNPQHQLVAAMGSVQLLPSGRVIVGWGVDSRVSGFSPGGELLADFALPTGMYSYRALLLPWSGTPHEPPAIAAERDRKNGRTLLYASWNGATEAAGWLVEAGPRRDQLAPLGIAKRRGFETVIPLHPQVRFAAATALDRHGRPLRRSAVIRL